MFIYFVHQYHSNGAKMLFRRSVRSVQLFHAFRTYSSSKTFVAVTVNDRTGVATATLQRPPINCLNLEFLTELANTITELEKSQIRGLILTSTFKSVFCAGLDILELQKPDPVRFNRFWTALQDTWMALWGTSFPTVAAINGHAPAGGCLLALCCEYRIMVNNFTIGLNETKVGIMVPPWLCTSMQNTLGLRKAELALTSGTLFTTIEALNIGLIDEVAESQEVAISKAELFLEKYNNVSLQARALTKRSLRNHAIMVELQRNRQEDIDTVSSIVKKDSTQKWMDEYLASLKKKK